MSRCAFNPFRGKIVLWDIHCCREKQFNPFWRFFMASTKYQTYRDLLEVVEKPQSKRPELAIGRGGSKVIARRYHMVSSRLQKLTDAFKAGDQLPNPFNRGCYYYTVEALKALGLNRNHSWTRFVEKYKELASAADTKNDDGKTDWQVFKNKESRNDATGQGYEGRMEQNIRVLQRTNIDSGHSPYGFKLLEVGQKVLGTKGCVIDLVYGSTGEVMVRLNTDSAVPQNDLKRVKKTEEEKVAAKAAKVAARKAAKEAKPAGKRGRKPKVVTGVIPETAAETAVAEPATAETAPTVEPMTEPVVPASVPFADDQETVATPAVTEAPAETSAPEPVAETTVQETTDTVAQ